MSLRSLNHECSSLTSTTKALESDSHFQGLKTENNQRKKKVKTFDRDYTEPEAFPVAFVVVLCFSAHSPTTP